MPRRYCNIEIGNEMVQSRVLVVDDEPKIIEVFKLAALAGLIIFLATTL